MKLTFEEKKLLYTYGCADLELTRKRLYEIAGLTVDPDLNRLVFDFVHKLEDESLHLERWYPVQRGRGPAHIQTYNAGLRKRLAAFSKKHPDLCRLEKSFAHGGVIYEMNQSRLSIRLQAPYSENAKQTGLKSRTE